MKFLEILHGTVIFFLKSSNITCSKRNKKILFEILRYRIFMLKNVQKIMHLGFFHSIANNNFIFRSILFWMIYFIRKSVNMTYMTKMSNMTTRSYNKFWRFVCFKDPRDRVFKSRILVFVFSKNSLFFMYRFSREIFKLLEKYILNYFSTFKGSEFNIFW